MAGLQPIVSLWVGGGLGKIEQLSLASFVANGHPMALYTYGDVGGVPAGVEIKDANGVLPRSRAAALLPPAGSYTLAADCFRLEAQRLGLGMWVDTDIVCIRPITLDGPFIAGRESDLFINNAVLRLDPQSPVLADWQAELAGGRVPPWTPFHRAPKAYFKQALGQKLAPNQLPRGSFGPKAITALAARHGLTDMAQPQEVFYPLHPRRAREAYDPALKLADIVTERTLAIHLWNEKLADLKQTIPPKGSIMDALMARYL